MGPRTKLKCRVPARGWDLTLPFPHTPTASTQGTRWPPRDHNLHAGTHSVPGSSVEEGGPAKCPAKSAAALPHPQGTVRLPNPDLPKVSTQGKRVVAVPRPGWCVGGQAGPGSRGGGELASEDPSQEGEPGCRAGGGNMQPALP